MESKTVKERERNIENKRKKGESSLILFALHLYNSSVFKRRLYLGACMSIMIEPDQTRTVGQYAGKGDKERERERETDRQRATYKEIQTSRDSVI